MKVSVITVNYNNASGLESTIQSVARQTGDFEYIVIDGGSTDGSAALLEKYKSVISTGISERDNGIYHAMNKGINYAKGDYCLFINSGDELYKEDVLKNALPLLDGSDLIYGDLLFVEPSGAEAVRKQPEKLSFYHMYFQTLYHPATFIKRSLFDRFGMYNEKLKIIADYEFFFKVVVFEKAATRYISTVIAKHFMDGISSLHENQSLIAEERKSVHLHYLPSLLVEEMGKYRTVINSRPYRWAEKLMTLKSKFAAK